MQTQMADEDWLGELEGGKMTQIVLPLQLKQYPQLTRNPRCNSAQNCMVYQIRAQHTEGTLQARAIMQAHNCSATFTLTRD